MSSFGAVSNNRRQSLRSQIVSSEKEVQGNQSKLHSDNFYEGVVTESDSCGNFVAHPLYVSNSRHADDFLVESRFSANLPASASARVPYAGNDKNSGVRTVSGAGAITGSCLSAVSRTDTSGSIGMKSVNPSGWKYASGQQQQQQQPGFASMFANFSNQDEYLMNQQQADSSERIEGVGLQLSRLPGIILERKNKLQIIDLSENSFQQFPVELCGFAQLRILRLEQNLLSELPESIAFLKCLEELSVSGNFLRTLPGSLQNLQQLRILNVADNCIVTFGTEVTNLKKLESLLIQSNEFTSIPQKLCEMGSLQELALDWFSYVKPPVDIFVSLPFHAAIYIKLFQLCNDSLTPQVSFKSFITHFSQQNSDYSSASMQFQQQNQFYFSPTNFSSTPVVSSLLHDFRGKSLAYKAAEEENIGVLRAILNEDPTLLDAVDKDNSTLLLQSLTDNKAKSIKCLLELGADPTKGGGPLGSCLHVATSRLQQDLVQKFLSAKSNPSSIDMEGNSPLHLVFSIFQKDPISAGIIAECLLSNGAHPNLVNKDKWTPLHLAVRKNQKDAIKFAIEYNKKLSAKLSANQVDSSHNIHQETDQNGPQNTASIRNISPSISLNKSKSCLADKSNPISPHSIQPQRSFNSLKLPRQEDISSDSEDNNEAGDKSPGIVPKNSSFNNLAATKLPKSVHKLFKLDKKGGANKWTPVHLAASQGNVSILEMFSEANSCPLTLNKFAQTPRKVALQSLVLFKIIKKQEIRWTNKNILDDDSSEASSNSQAAERTIQNLRGCIAEMMKQKEHFLQDQLDLFDDIEFGYAIKENMQNNQIVNPRNKGTGFETEEDEILDPDISYESKKGFRFSGIYSPQNQPIPLMESESVNTITTPAHSGTLKVQVLGSGLKRQNTKEDQTRKNQEFKVNNHVDEDMMENEDEMMDDIDEGPEDDVMLERNTGNAMRNNQKTSNHLEERSCVFLSNFNSTSAGIAPESTQNQQNGCKQEKPDSEKDNALPLLSCLSSNELFVEVHSLDSNSDYEAELQKLLEFCLHPQVSASEFYQALMFLRYLFIRLSEKKVKFVSEDKSTLPRNVHMLNEFLHSRLSPEEAQKRQEGMTKLLEGIIAALVTRIVPLPGYEQQLEAVRQAVSYFGSNVSQLQQLSYQAYNKTAMLHNLNAKTIQLILAAKDTLLNLNSRLFLSNYLASCAFFRPTNFLAKESSSQQQKQHKLTSFSFSNCDYSNRTFLDFENMHTGFFTTKFKQLPQGYQVIGSPSYWQQQQILKQQERLDFQNLRAKTNNTVKKSHSQIIILKDYEKAKEDNERTSKGSLGVTGSGSMSQSNRPSVVSYNNSLDTTATAFTSKYASVQGNSYSPAPPSGPASGAAASSSASSHLILLSQTITTRSNYNQTHASKSPDHTTPSVYSVCSAGIPSQQPYNPANLTSNAYQIQPQICNTQPSSSSSAAAPNDSRFDVKKIDLNALEQPQNQQQYQSNKIPLKALITNQSSQSAPQQQQFYQAKPITNPNQTKIQPTSKTPIKQRNQQPAPFVCAPRVELSRIIDATSSMGKASKTSTNSNYPLTPPLKPQQHTKLQGHPPKQEDLKLGQNKYASSQQFTLLLEKKEQGMSAAAVVATTGIIHKRLPSTHQSEGFFAQERGSQQRTAGDTRSHYSSTSSQSSLSSNKIRQATSRTANVSPIKTTEKVLLSDQLRNHPIPAKQSARNGEENISDDEQSNPQSHKQQQEQLHAQQQQQQQLNSSYAKYAENKFKRSFSPFFRKN